MFTLGCYQIENLVRVLCPCTECEPFCSKLRRKNKFDNDGHQVMKSFFGEGKNLWKKYEQNIFHTILKQTKYT